MCEDILVCECKNVCLKEIINAIQNGAKSIEDIQNSTNAGTICKMCISKEYDVYGERAVHIQELLK